MHFVVSGLFTLSGYYVVDKSVNTLVSNPKLSIDVDERLLGVINFLSHYTNNLISGNA